jgi:hypothetical protein
MAKLDIAAVVQYANLSPVPGATVNIIDLDRGGNGNDLILAATTDAQGKFRQHSKEWVDLNNVRIPWGGKMSTPDDLALQFRVEKDGKVHEGPFLFVSDGVLVSILTPWLPAEADKKP